MKKAGFNGYVYDFSIDYDATDADDIVDIHKYLIKNITWSKWRYLYLLKSLFFVGLTILSSFTNANSLNAIPLSCISINNQECETRP